MLNSRIYKCPNCNSILVLPEESWLKLIKCTVCETPMKLLDEEFDLSEIIVEENKKCHQKQVNSEKM